MQTITIKLTGKKSLKALQDLEHKQLIRIVKETDLDSYSLPGEPISKKDFIKWINYTENNPTVSLKEARQKWALQKKNLQKLIP